MQRKVPYYHLLLDLTDTKGALEEMKMILLGEQRKTRLIFFINAHCFNISLENKEYLKSLRETDYLFNDGIGIKIGARIAGIDLIENMNGTDFIPKVLHLACQTGKKIFFLGAKEGVAIAASENLKKRYPGIDICGTSSGFFDDDEEIIDKINNSDAEILIVGMGVPRQELWLTKNKEAFSNVKIAIAGGAIIDFLSGSVKRAPIWMQKAGIEWFFRFYQEPERLFKRYFVGNIQFISSILRIKLKS